MVNAHFFLITLVNMEICFDTAYGQERTQSFVFLFFDVSSFYSLVNAISRIALASLPMSRSRKGNLCHIIGIPLFLKNIHVALERINTLKVYRT